MYVKIGKYKSWFGPYQLADLLQKVGVSEDRCSKIGEYLNTTWVEKLLNWVDNKKSRKVKVRIDDHDIWSLDHTLSFIILPALLKIKECKQGVPFVDNADVPEELHSDDSTFFSDGGTFDKMQAKWDYVLNEMIFAFKSEHIDWRNQFTSGSYDMEFQPIDEGYSRLVQGPNHTFKIDIDGMRLYEKRIKNGFMLFGKYYQCLWT